MQQSASQVAIRIPQSLTQVHAMKQLPPAHLRNSLGPKAARAFADPAAQAWMKARSSERPGCRFYLAVGGYLCAQTASERSCSQWTDGDWQPTPDADRRWAKAEFLGATAR